MTQIPMATPKSKPDHHTDAPDIAWLQLAGALVSNEDLFLQWLAKADEDQRLVLLEAEALILRMQMRTRWEQAVLLDELGCTPKTRAAVPNMTVQQLGACRDYFAWVWDLVELQSNPLLCRKIVGRAWAFFKNGSRDLEQVRRAFGFADIDGVWKPMKDSDVLLRIATGDLDGAWTKASEGLPASVAA